MSEVKTSPVIAVHIPDKALFLAERVAGSFRLDEPDVDGEIAFWYCCPCGCRDIAPINVGNGFKPTDGPSWLWNGSTEVPDLNPSVHHVGHWHGYLRNGVWESC